MFCCWFCYNSYCRLFRYLILFTAWSYEISDFAACFFFLLWYVLSHFILKASTVFLLSLYMVDSWHATTLGELGCKLIFNHQLSSRIFALWRDMKAILDPPISFEHVWHANRVHRHIWTVVFCCIRVNLRDLCICPTILLLRHFRGYFVSYQQPQRLCWTRTILFWVQYM